MNPARTNTDRPTAATPRTSGPRETAPAATEPTPNPTPNPLQGPLLFELLTDIAAAEDVQNAALRCLHRLRWLVPMAGGAVVAPDRHDDPDDDPPQRGGYRVLAQWGLTPEVATNTVRRRPVAPEGAQAYPLDWFLEHGGRGLRVMRPGDRWPHDGDTDQRASLTTALLPGGAKEVLAHDLPLGKTAGSNGALFLWSRRRGAFDEAAYEVVHLAAKHLGLALLRLRQRDAMANLATRLAEEVDERRQVEDALRRQSDELRRSNEDLERFAYVTAHDLREPLRTIASYIGLIDRRYRDQLDDKGLEFMGYVTDSVGSMQRLIDDILEFSRIGRGERPIHPVDLNDVVSEVRDDLMHQLHEHDVVLRLDDLPTVVGDGRELRQVFQNLISNSIKFRGQRQPHIHVYAEDEPREGNARIRVSDNGIGMDPRYVDEIFAPFRRLHGRDEVPGSGVGLAICRKVIERHGGRIRVENTAPGRGTTLLVELPLAYPEDEARSAPAPDETAAREEQGILAPSRSRE